MKLSPEQEQEISQLRQNPQPTLRASAPELEEILYQPLPVLDHGFVRVIDYMGNDQAIVQAARVSYGKGTKKVNEDRGLIHYLLRHRHTTPFEMCEIKFHVKLPLFVSRQWLRHRTANINEYSARYSILDKEFYIPTPDQLATQSTSNRQGRDRLLSPDEAAHITKLLKEDAERVYQNYEYMLNEDLSGNTQDPSRDKLARELARMNLTLNFYTQWYWKIDLHNFMHFLTLRGDAHAQYEIRAYAEVMMEALKRWVPITYEAFIQYRKEGNLLSKNALNTIKTLIQGKTISQEESGMSKREWTELMDLLDHPTENA